ncbi:MAG: MBL fold metallo-hydrolase [Mariniblastus sp.]|nr:MBL fold metallo-hydrolase [Mariniblastus sp.]
MKRNSQSREECGGLAMIWLAGLAWLCLPTTLLAQDDRPAAAGAHDGVSLVVLGIAQDGGYPQSGCRKPCCQDVWQDHRLRRSVSCVAVVDHQTGQRWMFDCTPDFREQLRLLDTLVAVDEAPGLAGIFLTHAHIGHYTGLMHVGHEAMGVKQLPVYAMPRMEKFLTNHGPWSQLVSKQNILLQPMRADQPIRLNERVTVTPFQVPHRDEYSETVGFRIDTPGRSAIYLPDIDKWSKWDRSIEELVESVDVAYLDGTFFENGEIPGRDMAQIPHPFVEETIRQFAALDESQRNKVRFIHLNHTNPALRADSRARRQIQRAGMRVAVQGEMVEMEREKGKPSNGK